MKLSEFVIESEARIHKGARYDEFKSDVSILEGLVDVLEQVSIPLMSGHDPKRRLPLLIEVNRGALSLSKSSSSVKDARRSFSQGANCEKSADGSENCVGPGANDKVRLNLSDDPVSDALAVMHSLRRSFALLLEHGELRIETAEADNRESIDLEALNQYGLWIERQYFKFLKLLGSWISRLHQSAVLQVAALRTLMLFVQIDYQRLPYESPQFGREILGILVGSIASSSTAVPIDGQVLRVLGEEYLTVYTDVRIQTLSSIYDICQELNARKNAKNRASTPSSKWIVEALKNIDEFSSPQLFCDSVFNLLYTSSFETLGENDSVLVLSGKPETRKEGTLVKRLQKAFQLAWIEFLRCDTFMPERVYRRILLALPNRVVPFLIDPLVLSDFLTAAYNMGSSTAILALKSLFALICERNLDYPDFFPKLYRTLGLQVMYSKHRAQFFELLEKCLSSTHLASYLVSAFCKKLMRLALISPPGSAMFAIVMVSNLLKRHPTSLSIVHRMTESEKSAHQTTNGMDEDRITRLKEIEDASKMLALGPNAGGDLKKNVSKDTSDCQVNGLSVDAMTKLDKFKMDEADPAKSCAQESSLWELEALANHYNPNVSLLVKNLFYRELKMTIETKRIQPPTSIDDFTSATYRSLFDQEISKSKRKLIPLTFENKYAKTAEKSRSMSGTTSVFTF